MSNLTKFTFSESWQGGPGITKSDLFVINKTDLAPYVGADLSVMEADTIRMRTVPVVVVSICVAVCMIFPVVMIMV